MKLKIFYKANILKKKDRNIKEGGKKRKWKIMWYGDCHVSNFLTFKKSNNNDDLIYLVKIIKKRKKNW